MSVIQLKRTNKAVDSSADLSTLAVGIDNLEAGEMLWAFDDTANEGTGVLYIGDGDGTNHKPVPIGGAAYTSMLSPVTADTVTKLNSAQGSGTGASLVMGDGQNGGDSVTIDAPIDLTSSYSINLPSSAGGTGNSTIITTNASGKVPALSSSGGVDGTSLATTSNGSITANGSGNISTTSGNISTASGNIEATAGSLGGTSLLIDGSTIVATNGDVDGREITASQGISNSNASISAAGAISGISVTTTANGNITAHGSGNISTTSGAITTTNGGIAADGSITGTSIDVDSGDIGAVNVTTAGAISGVTTISASGKITAAELEVSGTVLSANTTDVTISDSMIQMGSSNAGNVTSTDVGWFGRIGELGTGEGVGGLVKQAGMVYDQSEGKFHAFVNDPAVANAADLESDTALGAAGVTTSTIIANIEGDITGNAATVTTNANLTGMVTSNGNATTVVTNANLTGDVTSVGNATTIASGAIDAGMLNVTSGDVNAVVLESLEDTPTTPTTAADDNKVLTYIDGQGLAWTGKGTTSTGAASSELNVVDDSGSSLGARIQLKDVDTGAEQDKLNILAGGDLSLTADTTDQKITISFTERTDAEVQGLVTKAVVDSLGINAAQVSGFTVAGNVGVAVPANADFSDHNNLDVSVTGDVATVQLSDDGASPDSITITGGTNLEIAANGSDGITLNATFDDDEVAAKVTKAYIEGKFTGEELTDWTTNTGSTIDPSNYVDNDTTYTGGNGIAVSGTSIAADLLTDGGLKMSGGKIQVDLADTSMSGQLANAGIASAGTWDATTSTVNAGSGGWDATKASVDAAEASFANAGALVKWGANGLLNTNNLGNVSSGDDIGVTVTGDGNVIFTINSKTLTLDDGGITAQSGAGMALTNFVSDGGEI